MTERQRALFEKAKARLEHEIATGQSLATSWEGEMQAGMASRMRRLYAEHPELDVEGYLAVIDGRDGAVAIVTSLATKQEQLDRIKRALQGEPEMETIFGTFR